MKPKSFLVLIPSFIIYSLVDELIDQLHVIPYAKKKTLTYDDHGAPLHESSYHTSPTKVSHHTLAM